MEKSFRTIHLRTLFSGYAQPYQQYLWIKIVVKNRMGQESETRDNFSILQDTAAHLLEMFRLAESLVAG